MWRWQSMQEFQYPLIEYLNAFKNLPLFLGIESVGRRPRALVDVGHHRPDAGVARQRDAADHARPAPAPYTPLGNATALAQWEYCFDRGDTDTSRGNPTGTAHRQQLELLGPRQPERGRSELERDGAEADPGRRRRHRHQGPQQDASRR